MKSNKKKNKKKITNLDKIYNSLTKNKPIVIIIILISLIAGIVGIYQFFKEPTNNNEITIQNSTLIKSPVIQKSSNISLTYNNPSEFMDVSFYPYVISMHTQTPDADGKRYNYYFMKIILPDNQEAFMEEVLFNKSYAIANCNEENTDCYVYHKFRINESLTEDNVCWIFTTRFGHENMSGDTRVCGKRFKIDPKSCMKLVNE